MFKTISIMDKTRRKDMLRRAKMFFDDRLDFIRGPIELNDMIKEGVEMNIIDVRRPDDYSKGHIPGAVNLPEDKWSTFKGLSKDRVNIVYCYSTVCQISTRAAKYFVEHDFPTIQLSGGIEEWKNNELPVET
jgi:rhodanese-related sulfurtransferase